MLSSFGNCRLSHSAEAKAKHTPRTHAYAHKKGGTWFEFICMWNISMELGDLQIKSLYTFAMNHCRWHVCWMPSLFHLYILTYFIRFIKLLNVCVLCEIWISEEMSNEPRMVSRMYGSAKLNTLSVFNLIIHFLGFCLIECLFDLLCIPQQSACSERTKYPISFCCSHFYLVTI